LVYGASHTEQEKSDRHHTAASDFLTERLMMIFRQSYTVLLPEKADAFSYNGLSASGTIHKFSRGKQQYRTAKSTHHTDSIILLNAGNPSNFLKTGY
jgi:hypothetical protein